MPLDSTTRFSVQDVCEQIGVLAEEAMRFVPPGQAQAIFRKWIPREKPAGVTHERAAAMAADAVLLAAELLLMRPSPNGGTAFDRLARGLRGRGSAQDAAVRAMRDACFRLFRLETLTGEEATARDLRTGEEMRLVCVDVPQEAVVGSWRQPTLGTVQLPVQQSRQTEINTQRMSVYSDIGRRH